MITKEYKISERFYLREFANILTLIGALNWGLIGVNNFNLVAYLFNPALSRAVYIVVGIAGIYLLITSFIQRRLKY